MPANHQAAKLSDLDLRIAAHVPVGGNWKSVPKGMSARIDKMSGGRTTQYGRLRPNRPAYTISTYYTRPGNGAHLHWDQERVISHREAARLQSFPDRFEFLGSQRAVATQIGNAVPPLLAFQLIQAFACRSGSFVDLFAGAGGLAQGLVWSGWKPVVANDIDTWALRTHVRNLGGEVVLGDIREKAVLDCVCEPVEMNRPEGPLAVVGGPPCQGFCLAGKNLAMDDPRNHLFRQYVEVVERLKPDILLFENVTGLATCLGGAVLAEIERLIRELGYDVRTMKVDASRHGVPQRRQRLIITGCRGVGWHGLRESCHETTCDEALSDLPPLENGQDGSGMDYRCDPESFYQRLMRGWDGPTDFLQSTRNPDRATPAG